MVGLQVEPAFSFALGFMDTPRRFFKAFRQEMLTRLFFWLQVVDQVSLW